jgi:gamma-glutamylcysteine synthetase
MITTSPRQNVAGLFPPRTGTATYAVGVEQELNVRDAFDGGVVSIDRLRRITDSRPYSPWLTFEPGGQVELSLPATPTVSALEQQFLARMGELRSDCADAGVVIDALPVDPRGVDGVPLQLVAPRYLAMQKHFDSIGPAGRKMMRLTASTQICLDWSPGPVGLEQWRVALLSAPFLAAAFARSHGPDSRLAIWLDVDPDRTAFDSRLLADDPVAAYADFAAGAVPFTSPEEHLTTLFPPVRPRGSYLEMRYIDVQPDDQVAPIAAMLSTLLYDDETRRAALRLLAGEASRLADWWRAAADGAPETVERGQELVAMTLPRVTVGAA